MQQSVGVEPTATVTRTEPLDMGCMLYHLSYPGTPSQLHFHFLFVLTASHFIFHIPTSLPLPASSSFCLDYIYTPLTHPTSCISLLSTFRFSLLPVHNTFSPPPTSSLFLHQCLSHKRKMRLLTFEKILLGSAVPSAPAAEIQMNRKQRGSTRGHLLAVNEKGSTL